MIQALLVVGMFGMFFLGALYLQRILGYDPLEVGLAFLPATIVMGMMSLRFSDPLTMRFGPRATLIAGLVLIGAGLLLFARTPVDGSYVTDILPPMILIGLGAGLGFPSLMTLAMSGATPSDSGLASGLVNTSVQVGGAIGLAVLATLATERTDAPARRRRVERRRAQLRLPPRLPDRGRARGRRDRARRRACCARPAPPPAHEAGQPRGPALTADVAFAEGRLTLGRTSLLAARATGQFARPGARPRRTGRPACTTRPLGGTTRSLK